MTHLQAFLSSWTDTKMLTNTNFIQHPGQYSKVKKKVKNVSIEEEKEKTIISRKHDDIEREWKIIYK